MNELIATIIDELSHFNSWWIYLLMFVVAFVEAFALTTFVFHGTIALVLIGAALGQGFFNPFSTFLVLYFGTLTGDTASYLASDWIQSRSFMRRYLPKIDSYRAPLRLHPARFVVLGHTTPYLRGVLSLMAAGVIPWKRWFLMDIIGAFLGNALFLSIGVTAGRYFSSGAHEVRQLGTYLGLVVFAVFMILWLRSTRILCPLKYQNSPRRSMLQRTIFFFALYPLWHPIRFVEKRLRKLPARYRRVDFDSELANVRAGDILLVRLHSMAPWGKWAHSILVTDGDHICHGFSSEISRDGLSRIPVRYAIAHLRVRCSDDSASRAAGEAVELVGQPVHLLAQRGDSSKFSCSSMVHHCYHSVGIDLVPNSGKWIIPDDLYHSRDTELLQIIYTERTRRGPKELFATRPRDPAHSGAD